MQPHLVAALSPESCPHPCHRSPLTTTGVALFNHGDLAEAQEQLLAFRQLQGQQEGWDPELLERAIQLEQLLGPMYS